MKPGGMNPEESLKSSLPSPLCTTIAGTNTVSLLSIRSGVLTYFAYFKFQAYIVPTWNVLGGGLLDLRV